jgi:hypothetical protein
MKCPYCDGKKCTGACEKDKKDKKKKSKKKKKK